MSLPTPPLPKEIWDRTPPEAQAFILGLLATVDRMQSRIEALEAEVSDLKTRLDQNSSNSHKPPSSDPPWSTKLPKPKSGRKRGGQPGHEGKFRALLPPERVDERIDHFPSDCRFCGDDLAHAPLATAPRRHQVCEIPPVKVTVTEHRMHGRQCQRCRNVTFATAPVGVAASSFGPNLEAFVATLIGRYRLSRREARQLVTDLTDVSVSLGTVVAICNRVSRALAAPVELIAEAVRRSPVAYVDETGFPEAGKRRWLWAAVTPAGTYYRIHNSRSQAARQDVIGSHVPGQKRISDRYGGYSDIPISDRALCHAHLKRDLEGLKGRSDASDEIAERLQREQKRLFVLHNEIRSGSVTGREANRRIRMLKARFGRWIRAGLDLPDKRVRTFCGELDRLWPAIFACLDHPGVEPTNNHAERALRPAVIWRKTSFGTASDNGNRFAERILTIAATCRQHGRNLFRYVTEVHSAFRLGLTPPALLPT